MRVLMGNKVAEAVIEAFMRSEIATKLIARHPEHRGDSDYTSLRLYLSILLSDMCMYTHLLHTGE
jgi:hypothetical protein